MANALLKREVDTLRDYMKELSLQAIRTEQSVAYPEFAGRRVVGILASLYPEPAVVQFATRKGVLVMGMGDETMDVLNPQAAGTASAPTPAQVPDAKTGTPRE